MSDEQSFAVGASARPRPGASFAMVSTFPPTACGVATFSAALRSGLVDHGGDVGIVRVGGAGTAPAPAVVGELGDDGRASSGAVRALEDADVVILQHEYGLYAGRDGASVVELIAGLERPSIVVAHTVLQDPTANQRAVLEGVVDEADAVVVMTEAGRRRLCAGFDVDPDKISVIVHGAAVADGPRRHRAATGREILTWGLLGPGKGIEWAIDALALLDDSGPEVAYRVAGATHPKVAAAQGEAYREMLVRRAAAAGVTHRVHFDAGYRSVTELMELIGTAAVVVLPYDSPDQVTSGVLVDAVASGRPVIATAFPHAVELLASGAGLVVPRRDPDALAGALRRVLTEPGLAGRMSAEARRIAPGLAWRAVASQYADLGRRLLARRVAVA